MRQQHWNERDYSPQQPPRRRGCAIALGIHAFLFVATIVVILIISFLASSKQEVILDGYRIPTITAVVGDRRAHFGRTDAGESTHTQVLNYPVDSWGNTLTQQDLIAYARHLEQHESFHILNLSETNKSFSAVKPVSGGRVIGIQASEVRGTLTLVYALIDGFGAADLLDSLGGLGSILGSMGLDLGDIGGRDSGLSDSQQRELLNRAQELTDGMTEGEIRDLINRFLSP
jgi:hypothetical protein